MSLRLMQVTVPDDATGRAEELLEGTVRLGTWDDVAPGGVAYVQDAGAWTKTLKCRSGTRMSAFAGSAMGPVRRKGMASGSRFQISGSRSSRSMRYLVCSH